MAFMNWCVVEGRAHRNPLKGISSASEQADQRRRRRALTLEELQRLLAVAAKREEDSRARPGRKAWYMAAFYAGLRRSELRRLEWRHIDFSSSTLSVTDGKGQRLGREAAAIPLFPALADELKSIRPKSAEPTDRVFPTEVTNNTRRRDFKRARIPLKDSEGRVVDLHALRTTLATWLALLGVSPQMSRQIMRHAKGETTLKHYTVLEAAHLVDAIRRLPELNEPQQIPQQSLHENLRNGASEREIEAASGRIDTTKKAPQLRALPEDSVTATGLNSGGADETRTRDLRRDRPAF